MVTPPSTNASRPRSPRPATSRRTHPSAGAKHGDSVSKWSSSASRLTALALDAGDLITIDTTTVTRDITLPDHAGRTAATFTICGLIGFLAAKIAALTGRDKPKDAYDVIWVLESWPGGPAAAAAAVLDNPAYGRPDAIAAFGRLFDAFSSADRVGPASYARFFATAETTRDERLRLARRAAGAVSELRVELER